MMKLDLTSPTSAATGSGSGASGAPGGARGAAAAAAVAAAAPLRGQMESNDFMGNSLATYFSQLFDKTQHGHGADLMLAGIVMPNEKK
jgi:hypothetical protein